MASDGITVKLEGIDEMKRALASAAKDIRTKAVRNSLRAAGRVIQAAAKAAAPVLQAPTKTRAVGTLKKAIAVRTSKFARQAGDEGVFIGIRPLRGSRQKKLGRAGASNSNDPYYWRFVEFGTKSHEIRPKNRKALAWAGGFSKLVKHPGTKGARFLTASADKGSEAVAVFMRSVVPQIEKLNAKAASRVR